MSVKFSVVGGEAVFACHTFILITSSSSQSNRPLQPNCCSMAAAGVSKSNRERAMYLLCVTL